MRNGTAIFLSQNHEICNPDPYGLCGKLEFEFNTLLPPLY